jgi:hypothetical protein
MNSIVIGNFYGRWKVLKKVNKKGVAKYLCECSCENKTTKIVLASHLKNGSSKSCGCFSVEKFIERLKKYNKYDLTGEYGIGYTYKNEKFIFDLDDYEKIREYMWNINNNGYVRSSRKNSKKTIYLHKLIMNNTTEVIDHMNNIRYDCRKLNLRKCTTQQNSFNKKLSKNSRTGIIGVNLRKNNYYVSRIRFNAEYIDLGYFKNIDDAIYVRLLAEKKYFGEFAPQKHLFEKYGVL